MVSLTCEVSLDPTSKEYLERRLVVNWRQGSILQSALPLDMACQGNLNSCAVSCCLKSLLEQIPPPLVLDQVHEHEKRAEICSFGC